MSAELINCRIPFISIPLPSSAENHQLFNAKYFESQGSSFLVEERNIEKDLFTLIKSIHEDKSLLNQMREKQKKQSDKKVFELIDKEITKSLNEKIDLGKKETIHFIGIGGIGMSGLPK